MKQAAPALVSSVLSIRRSLVRAQAGEVGLVATIETLQGLYGRAKDDGDPTALEELLAQLQSALNQIRGAAVAPVAAESAQRTRCFLPDVQRPACGEGSGPSATRRLLFGN